MVAFDDQSREKEGLRKRDVASVKKERYYDNEYCWEDIKEKLEN